MTRWRVVTMRYRYSRYADVSRASVAIRRGAQIRRRTWWQYGPLPAGLLRSVARALASKL